jgi:preprotein translocase subunit SecE
MIKRIFINITKYLNSIIKFISIRILKRKKGMTLIDFIFLVLSEFQKTVFYKALTIIYKIVAVMLAFLSLGIFYDNNYNFTNISDFINNICNIIIGIYNILINTLKSIFKLIFKNIYKNNEDLEIDNEPYEYYMNKTEYNLGPEAEYTGYPYWYETGGILLLLLLLGYGYKKWDSDSDIKDNLIEIGSGLFSVITFVKELILNKIKNIRNNSSETSEDGNSFDSNRNSTRKCGY